MEARIEIRTIDKDTIQVLGVKYYAEKYLIEMMRREYSRGKKENEVIHRVENIDLKP